MTPQDARDAMIAAGMLAWDWQDRGDEHLVAAYFDALTERGFSISLDSVRDHTRCQMCKGRGVQYREQRTPAVVTRVGEYDWHYTVGSRVATRSCPGGSPVVWSVEP